MVLHGFLLSSQLTGVAVGGGVGVDDGVGGGVGVDVGHGVGVEVASGAGVLVGPPTVGVRVRVAVGAPPIGVLVGVALGHGVPVGVNVIVGVGVGDARLPSNVSAQTLGQDKPSLTNSKSKHTW